MESQASVVYLNFRYNMRMLSFILVAVGFILLDPQLAGGSANCSAEDTLCAKSLGSHYVPEEAYAFGNLIRQQVEKRDVEGLLSLFGRLNENKKTLLSSLIHKTEKLVRKNPGLYKSIFFRFVLNYKKIIS